MDESFFQTSFANPTDECDISPDGLVYNHLQLTLQAQLEYQHVFQEASTEPNPFDSLYECLTADNLMNELTPSFHSNMYTFMGDMPYTEESSICHPLSPFPTFNADFFTNTYHDPILSEGLDTCFEDTTSYNIPLERTRTTPILSASFSLSSFSSSTSEEDEAPKQKKTGKVRKTKQRKGRLSSTLSDLAYQVAKSHMSDDDDDKLKKGRNVDKACNHCKRSHLRCDNARPCNRCVATGKEECHDVLHKPRGRPRLSEKKKSLLALE